MREIKMMAPESINLIGRSFDELMAMFYIEVDDDDYYDIIAIRMAVDYTELLIYLMNILSGKRLRAALIGLRFVQLTDRIVHTIREYLHHQDERIVVAALDTLRQNSPVRWEDISIFLKNNSSIVRGAAIRFAKARMGIDAVPLLLDSLKDKDAVIRENALDELDGLAGEEFLPLIEPLLNDESSAVREAASSLRKTIRKN